jgi:hypothetical protein
VSVALTNALQQCCVDSAHRCKEVGHLARSLGPLLLLGFPIVTMLLRPAYILPSFAIIAYSDTVGYFCVKIMDVGNTTGSKALELYAPGRFYYNCTATLYNIDGIISSPVSGATFTWQNKDGTRTIVAARQMLEQKRRQLPRLPTR